MFIGKFKNGALANLEATRFALGRKNHIAIEINGSKGSLSFDFEDMNRLKFFDNTQPPDRQGFRDILVTQGGGVHPYVGNWWPPGHIIGYEQLLSFTPSPISSRPSSKASPCNPPSRTASKTNASSKPSKNPPKPASGLKSKQEDI